MPTLRNHKRLAVCGAAVAMVAMMLASAPPAGSHWNPGYANEDTAFFDLSDWMSLLPDESRISELSLPGTHDTGAYNVGGPITETQGMNVSEQLKAGIRVWDMRLGTIDVFCPGPDLWTFHGFTCQFEKFSDHILPAAQAFLRAHTRETILMRVKHEHGDIPDFASQVEAEMDAFPGLFYEGPDSNPLLGQVRGKIVLLRDYPDSSRGIPWSSLDIQDNYNHWEVRALADKWRLETSCDPPFEGAPHPWRCNVVEQLVAAEWGPDDKIYVNFLSGSSKSGAFYPYFFASGHITWGTGDSRLATGWTTADCYLYDRCLDEYPRVECLGTWCTVAYEGINTLAMNFINLMNYLDTLHRTGIVMADFPGPGLILAIIAVNAPDNREPVASAGGPYTADENSPIQFDASGSTDPDGDPLQYRWDFDGDGTFDTTLSPSPLATHTFPDDFVGTATVEVWDGLATSTATAGVTVNNVAPVLTATAEDVDENGTTTVSGTIVDPGSLDTFTLTVDWGESAPESFSYPAGTTTYSETHQYLDDDPSGTAVDPYTISLAVADDDGGVGTASDTILVSNVDPVVTLDSVADETGTEVGDGIRLALINTRVDVAASFTDIGSQDTHTGSVDWGDGTVEDLGPTPGTTSAGHVYATTGIYTVTVTITDDDLGSHSQSRDLVLTDAAGAFEATAEALALLAADPTIPGHEDIGTAVDWLVGNNGGRAANGAVDLLDRGNLNAALGKVVKSLQGLESAEAAGAPDLDAHESMLVLAAKSAAVGAADEAQAAAVRPRDLARVAAARAHIEDATTLMLAGNHLAAATDLQLSAQALGGRVR